MTCEPTTDRLALHGMIFDLDGTLVDSGLDFDAIRRDMGLPAGMPILDAYKSRTIMVIKRGMSPGFAGIDNELYYMDKTLMLFGDAKSFVGSIVKELSANHG